MITGSESRCRPHAKGTSYFGGGKMNNACGLSFGCQKSILNLYYLNFPDQFNNQILKNRKNAIQAGHSAGGGRGSKREPRAARVPARLKWRFFKNITKKISNSRNIIIF
jgi:hypothetical protein